MFRGGPFLRTRVVIVLTLVAIDAAIVVYGQMPTRDRVRGPGWWPTQETSRRADYVGTAACTPCHRTQAASQPATSMARTAIKAERSDLLRASRRLTFDSGGYSYRIESDAGRSLYTVTDGTHTASAPLTWAFGMGHVGQSFLFTNGGAFYEARVSYYESMHALAFTPGRAVTAPTGLDEAMARRVNETEARRCFACHTTAPTTEGKFDPSNAIPGVTCEACHGPGRRHVDAMKVTRRVGGLAPMLNPAKLPAEESVDFCGACHATFWDIALDGVKGIPALRSQPYRLQSSRCWTASAGDARLTCIACHDPHRPLVTGARAYDNRCLGCHLSAGAPPTSERRGPACPVRTSDCATCHMPKYDVPDMHHEFTDHLIRVTQR
jgi:cytochrome c554/c'-like protein